MCNSIHLFFLGTDYTDFTDKLVFTFTKNRVNPCNPCLNNRLHNVRLRMAKALPVHQTDYPSEHPQ